MTNVAQEEEHPDIRFKNRRRMAWIAFYFMLCLGGWMLIYGVLYEGGAERVEKLSFLLGTIFGMCTTIIVSYFAGSSITDINDLKFSDDTKTARTGASGHQRHQPPPMGNP